MQIQMAGRKYITDRRSIKEESKTVGVVTAKRYINNKHPKRWFLFKKNFFFIIPDLVVSRDYYCNELNTFPQGNNRINLYRKLLFLFLSIKTKLEYKTLDYTFTSI